MGRKVEKVRKVRFFQGDHGFVKEKLEIFFSEHDYEFAQPELHYHYEYEEDEECVMIEYFVKREG